MAVNWIGIISSYRLCLRHLLDSWKGLELYKCIERHHKVIYSFTSKKSFRPSNRPWKVLYTKYAKWDLPLKWVLQGNSKNILNRKSTKINDKLYIDQSRIKKLELLITKYIIHWNISKEWLESLLWPWFGNFHKSWSKNCLTCDKNFNTPKCFKWVARILILTLTWKIS